MKRPWNRSAQEIDPLSWFTGPRPAIVFAWLAAAQGLVITFALWAHWSNPWLQLAAIPCYVLGGHYTASVAQPTRSPYRPRHAIVPIALACIGLILSAVGAAGGAVSVDRWWAPIAVAITFAVLAPYSSALWLLAFSVPILITAVTAGSLAFIPGVGKFAPVAAVVLIAAPILSAAIAASVFSLTIVKRTEAAMNIGDASGEEWSHGRIAPDSETIGRVSHRVAPFLRKIADAGVITEADRAIAGQLARRLRSDLVEANASWLERLAVESALVVSDPDRLADRMNDQQKAALRGLLVSVLENEIAVNESLLIELRTAPDKSTAVALSMDVDLPEGMRLRMLAPYYLTLKATVDGLTWSDGRSVTMKFRVPGGS